MKIGILGTGSWGYGLAWLLGLKGIETISWSVAAEEIDAIEKAACHPRHPSAKRQKSMAFTKHLPEALDVDLLVESVTTAGVRPTLEKIKGALQCPLIVTSKGIEQNSEMLLSEIAEEVLGKIDLAVLSGPTIADEVMRQMPTSIVVASASAPLMTRVQELFSNEFFRVYTNADVIGVQFGGAVKNVIAIACGIAHGLGFGDNTRAALITRGLAEMRRLAVVKGVQSETLMGLAGMGDLCVTCMSTMSRNFRFGTLIGQGASAAAAREQMGSVAIEGLYTCVSALQLAKKHRLELPIAEAVHNVVFRGLQPSDAVRRLMLRAPKSED